MYIYIYKYRYTDINIYIYIYIYIYIFIIYIYTHTHTHTHVHICAYIHINTDRGAIWQSYGIKFPRDFGLLVKQALYFDRHPSRIPHRYTLHLNPETLIPKH